MTSPKRPCGRPRGSEINDTPALAQIADLLVREATLKPTTAMKRVMRARKDWGATDATLLRRWQGKWSQRGAALLAAARERARPKPAVSSPSPSPFLSPMATIASAIKAAVGIDLAKIGTVAQFAKGIAALESPTIKLLADHINQLESLPIMQTFAVHRRLLDTLAPALRINEEHQRARNTLAEQQHAWDAHRRIFNR